MPTFNKDNPTNIYYPKDELFLVTELTFNDGKLKSTYVLNSWSSYEEAQGFIDAQIGGVYSIVKVFTDKAVG